MKIGLIGAMQEEVLLLKDELSELKNFKIGTRTFYQGKLGNCEIVMCLSGWGKVAAASTATTLINHFGVGELVFIGLAGSLSSSLSIGDIVVADSLVQHDVDLTHLGDFPDVKPPFWKTFCFPVREEKVERAVNALNEFKSKLEKGEYSEISRTYFPQVVVGAIGTGDQFVASDEQKEKIRLSYPHVLCVEMEGAALAQVAADYDLPLTVIRIISDNADSQAHHAFAEFLFQTIDKISVEIAKLLLR